MTQVASSVPFDNSTNGFIAEDVQAAIEESKSGKINFSVVKVLEGETVVVPENQQMLYIGDISIAGDLLINGDIRQITNTYYDSFSLGTVEENECIVIPENKVLFYRNLRVLGDIRLLGDMVEM